MEVRRLILYYDSDQQAWLLTSNSSFLGNLSCSGTESAQHFILVKLDGGL
jgi:hypothetical protein